MTALKIRRIPFDFTHVEFVWNPKNPLFAIEMNQISFFAIAFEKYICRAMNDAEALITDPAVLEECRAFRSQESIHAMAHRKHARALIDRYSGLNEALEMAIKSFDDLYVAHPLKYHLGYIGGLESVFTPYFKLLIDQRAILFAGGDARVASLLLWHFCEEIEHRSSGIAIYDHLVGSYGYRIGNFFRYFGHSAALFNLLGKEFEKHVPGLTQIIADAKQQKLPLKNRLAAFFGVLHSQMPWHQPVAQAIPDYFDEWNAKYEQGEDMTRVYGVNTLSFAEPA
jgi:hypothetical protein